MLPLLDPTLDVVFKLLFTRDAEDSKAALLGLVTAVLRPPQPIASLEVRNPAITLEEVDEKGVVLDILVGFGDGSTCNLEMQARQLEAFRNRLLSYWARTFGQKLGSSEPYTTLRPAISVAFLSYRETENPRFHSVFRILETHDHTPYGEALTIHLVQLPRSEEPTDLDRRENAAPLRWSRFVNARSEAEIEAAAMNDPAVRKARDILHRLSADPDARQLAEKRELAQITRRIEDGALSEAAERRGEVRSLRLGEEQELPGAIRDICELLGIELSEERGGELDRSDGETLAALKRQIMTSRVWP